MDKSGLHDAIFREICIALDVMDGDAKPPHGAGAITPRSPDEIVYLRKCDDAIRRAARELQDGWN